MMLSFLITSCESVRKGLTGSKNQSTDEFLVKKKDPLILPPDFENLPNPSERNDAAEKINTAITELTRGADDKALENLTCAFNLRNKSVSDQANAQDLGSRIVAGRKIVHADNDNEQVRKSEKIFFKPYKA